jgi:hypothetical protein
MNKVFSPSNGSEASMKVELEPGDMDPDKKRSRRL